jgi:hypothetical protein
MEKMLSQRRGNGGFSSRKLNWPLAISHSHLHFVDRQQRGGQCDGTKLSIKWE